VVEFKAELKLMVELPDVELEEKFELAAKGGVTIVPFH
jgi:hypothetical protein